MPDRPMDTRPAPLDSAAGDALAEFRVNHPREVLELLRSLRDLGTPVSISGPQGLQLSATLWTLDPDRRRMSFDVEPGDPRTDALVAGNEALAVTYLDSIKLQFDLADLVLVRGARASALQVSLPTCVYRFQRRASYRVRTPERHGAQATLRHPGLPDMRLTMRLLDVSAGGCALLLPPDVPPLPLGTVVNGVQLELDAETAFVATLRLQHVTSLPHPAAGVNGVRLGCEFHHVQPDAARALQRYIDQTQKYRRQLGSGV